MKFNNELIKAIHIPQAHTDGDLLVYLANSQILFVGDLIFSIGLPFIDVYNSGGTIEGTLHHIKVLIDTLSPETRIICSHGPDYSVLELESYLKMLTETKNIVWQAAAMGIGPEQMIKEKFLERWEVYNWSQVNTAQWLKNLYDGYLLRGSKRVSICEPLTKAIVLGDVDSAIQLYHNLKRDRQSDYDFSEFQLNMLGYQLMSRGRIEDAIKIFKLNTKQYPNSFNVFDSLAEAYMKSGDRKLAIKYYKKSLELNPFNDNAIQKLRDLQGE